jgi:hypothetical protein
MAHPQAMAVRKSGIRRFMPRRASLDGNILLNYDAFAKIQRMAKQKFRPTRPGGFSGAKAYIRYVEVLKKRRNAVGRTFCDAIKVAVIGK